MPTAILPTATEDEVRSSRLLLLPGPQPPQSHFGVTLMRYVATTGLRYTLYQLGFPMPDVPPFHIVQLRLYFNVRALVQHLEPHDGGNEMAASLADPGGRALPSQRSQRLSGTASFHRARLRLKRPKPPSATASQTTGWESFRTLLSDWLPYLNELFLIETLAAMHRRSARGRGQQRRACFGRAAFDLGEGRFTPGVLGLPDPLYASWNEEETRVRHEVLLELRNEHPELVAGFRAARVSGRGRGAFREAYRLALDALRTPYQALAEEAVGRAHLTAIEEAFFIPLDLGSDLESDTELDWLEDAVRSNRSEFEAAHHQSTPAETLSTGSRILAEGAPDPLWEVSPLLPLP